MAMRPSSVVVNIDFTHERIASIKHHAAAGGNSLTASAFAALTGLWAAGCRGANSRMHGSIPTRTADSSRDKRLCLLRPLCPFKLSGIQHQTMYWRVATACPSCCRRNYYKVHTAFCGVSPYGTRHSALLLPALRRSP